MGVDHRGFDILVPEQILDGSDVLAALEQVGGEGVAECMAGDALLDTSEFGCPVDGFLQGAGAYVMALGKSAAWICRELWGGEDELPDPLAWRIWVFTSESVG